MTSSAPVPTEQWAAAVAEAKEIWREADIEVNTVGGGVNLDINGNQVMQEWETALMEILSNMVTKNGGRILEVGFGLGISAGFIQKHDIQEHVIIEANKGVFQSLEKFAASAPHKVTPLLGFWQEVCKTLPANSFDGVLFDHFPIADPDYAEFKFAFIPEAHRLLKPGGIFTYYAHERVDFSPEHRAAIDALSWRSVTIEVVPVHPPPECVYWQHDTMIAPLLIKR